MDTVIRKATGADLDILTQMLTELFRIESDFTVNPVKQRTALAMIIGGDTGGMIFVSETGSRITGMVNLQKIVSTAAGGYSILLEDLYVIPEFRNRGTGRMLLEQAIKWGKEIKALRIQLAADIRNLPAISFYREHGFSRSSMIFHYKSI